MKIFLHKLAQVFKPNRKVFRHANRLARHAHMDWVVCFFFCLYFLDSFLIFLPAEGLLALTLLWAPSRLRTWVLAAVAGAISGFIIFYFLSMSSFKPLVIALIHENDMSQSFDTVVNSASRFGYAYLILAVSTVVPPIACLVAGIFIGLNPFVVLLIVTCAKVMRIFLMIYLMRYLKIAIVGLRGMWEHRKDGHFENGES